ncbi:MAG: hypothetical protein FWF99_06790 [Desulfovibrionaceae bacterium]|nr:hypothetical protein [Desulfovibrionaceae bacterium]
MQIAASSSWQMRLLGEERGSLPGAGDKSAADRELLERLQARDLLVRGHESAHILAAGGQATGPARYDYQTGPDGRQYAIGGSVDISIVSSPASDEEAAIQAETARRAATANGEMSLADMRVATRAAELSARARNRALEAYAGQAAAFGQPAFQAGSEEMG